MVQFHSSSAICPSAAATKYIVVMGKDGKCWMDGIITYKGKSKYNHDFNLTFKSQLDWVVSIPGNRNSGPACRYDEQGVTVTGPYMADSSYSEGDPDAARLKQEADLASQRGGIDTAKPSVVLVFTPASDVERK